MQLHILTHTTLALTHTTHPLIHYTSSRTFHFLTLPLHSSLQPRIAGLVSSKRLMLYDFSYLPYTTEYDGYGMCMERWCVYARGGHAP